MANKRPGMVVQRSFIKEDSFVYTLYTVAINDLLCMKNAGVQISMDFS